MHDTLQSGTCGIDMVWAPNAAVGYPWRSGNESGYGSLTTPHLQDVERLAQQEQELHDCVRPAVSDLTTISFKAPDAAAAGSCALDNMHGQPSHLSSGQAGCMPQASQTHDLAWQEMHNLHKQLLPHLHSGSDAQLVTGTAQLLGARTSLSWTPTMMAC